MQLKPLLLIVTMIWGDDMDTSEQGKVKSDEPVVSDRPKGLTDFPFGPSASRFWVYFMTLILPTLALILILLYCISLSE